MRNSMRQSSVMLLMLALLLTLVQGTAFGATEGTSSDLVMTAKVSESKPAVGETVDLTVAISSGDGYSLQVEDGFEVTVDKPYLVKPINNEKLQILAVGEATITVEGYGQTQSIKLASVSKGVVEGAKVVKGVTYVPLVATVKALGGTANADSSKKGFNIRIGDKKMTVTKGTAKSVVDGKTVVLKGAPLVDNGQTLVSADFLVQLWGAKLKWESANNRLVVSLGEAQLIINGAKKSSGGGKKSSSRMYEVAATGEMAGWKILKGHPYEKSLRVYFDYQNGMLYTHVVDIRPVDLNRKVSWVDDSGKKRVNTVRQIYDLFSYSNEYTSSWLSAKFGDLYADWLLSSSFDSTSLVEEYLIQSGQMESPESFVTLTPDTVFQ